MNLRDVYLKNSLVHFPLYELTRGKGYGETLRFLREAEGWTKEMLNDWELAKLQDIVQYAIGHVPYYRNLYRNIGLTCGKDIDSFDAFRHLPTITKKDIKDNFDEFISDDPHLQRREFCTSGTSMPFSFFLDDCFNGREQAYFSYYWEKTGNKGGYIVDRDKCVILRGDKISSREHFEYDKLRNSLILDSDYVNNLDVVKKYDSILRKYGGRYILAYPSSLFNLAKSYQDLGYKAPSFGTVYLGSENTYPFQIELIKETFNAESVYYHYGHSEQVLLGLKYDHSDEMGFIPQYGFPEILDNSGHEVQVGEIGELTGTTWSRAMPFIRYRTSDWAKKGSYNDNGYLKNAYSVARIMGREQEYFVREDGELVSLVSVCGAHMPELGLFKEMQFEQSRPGEVIINGVLDERETFTYNAENAIKRAIIEKFEGKASCVVHLVDEVSRGANKKGKMIVQHLDIDSRRIES